MLIEGRVKELKKPNIEKLSDYKKVPRNSKIDFIETKKKDGFSSKVDTLQSDRQEKSTHLNEKSTQKLISSSRKPDGDKKQRLSEKGPK
jgi:hypothetical protein